MKFSYPEYIYNKKSAEIVVPKIVELLSPKSVLDVGCGLGTWLRVFKENGIDDIQGVDFNEYNQSILVKNEHYICHDLCEELNLNRSFDLVLSLEVAEHLPKYATKKYLKTLANHGNAVLFSAAIPGQGGNSHVNEKWPSDWRAIFSEFEFYFSDVIRDMFWDDKSIDVWYRQNMFLAIKRDNKIDINRRPTFPIDIVHPDLFTIKSEQADRMSLLEQGKLGLQIPLKSLIHALFRKMGIK